MVATIYRDSFNCVARGTQQQNCYSFFSVDQKNKNYNCSLWELKGAPSEDKRGELIQSEKWENNQREEFEKQKE